jgi:hypothetical protein
LGIDIVLAPSAGEANQAKLRQIHDEIKKSIDEKMGIPRSGEEEWQRLSR